MIPETLYVLPDTIISDTLYKNVVVEESLQFYSTPFVASRITGVDTITHMVKVDTLAVFDSAWKFDEQLAFLPIAGKGLHANSYYIKPDWFPACSSLIMRNNCFTMEVHNTFVYKGKEMVYAGGDDDFFVYIDGEIVINQPGYHGVKPQLVMLDSLGLAKGSAHQFAMFLASRRWGNGFLIVTSIDFLQKNVGDTVMKIPAASGVIGNGYNRSAWNAAEAGGSLQMQRLDIFNAAGARVGSGEPRDFQNARGGCARMPGIYLIKAATPSGKTVPLCVIAAP
jgi:fibro-slime domain-containing protein